MSLTLHLDINTTDRYQLLYKFLQNTSDGNNTDTGLQDDEIDIVRCVLVGILLSIIVVASFIGNLLVVLAIWTNRRLRTVTNCFVASLAMADLLVSCLVMPLHIVVELTGRWWFGFIICDIWTSLDVLFCTASILNLCCISVDRYFAITRPLVYATRRSKKLALIMIAVVWVASTLITCPPIFGWQEADRWRDDTVCMLTKDPGYIIYSSLGSFFIPMIIMLFVYGKIFRVTYERETRLKPYRRSVMMGRRKNLRALAEDISLSDVGTLGTLGREDSEDKYDFESTIEDEDATHKHSTVVKHNNRNTRSNGSHQNTTTTIPKLKQKKHAIYNGNLQSNTITTSTNLKLDQRSENKRMRAVMARERKAAKTLSIVVGAFILCWLPFFLVYVIEPFCKVCSFPPILLGIVVWLGYVNSTLNPMIYAFSNRDFSHSYYQLTIGKIKKCKEKWTADSS